MTDHNQADLQREIDAIGWYHEFDFGNGLRATSSTPDVESHRVVWAFIREHLDKIVFAGKSVLDIGCWDGYWSFYAEQRGAARVLATDDHSQNWSNGNGLLLARRLLNSAIEVDQNASVYDISRLNQTFDIVLCLGVYYHLVDPFAAFAQVRHCCHPGSVVVFEGDATLALRPDSLKFDLRDHSNSIFLPTPHTLRQMIEAAYFDIVSQSWRRPPRSPSLLSRYKILSSVLGLHDAATLPPPGKVDRMITVCAPHYGRNALHVYKPPFDLSRYDPRFSEGMT